MTTLVVVAVVALAAGGFWTWRGWRGMGAMNDAISAWARGDPRLAATGRVQQRRGGRRAFVGVISARLELHEAGCVVSTDLSRFELTWPQIDSIESPTIGGVRIEARGALLSIDGLPADVVAELRRAFDAHGNDR